MALNVKSVLQESAKPSSTRKEVLPCKVIEEIQISKVKDAKLKGLAIMVLEICAAVQLHCFLQECN